MTVLPDGPATRGAGVRTPFSASRGPSVGRQRDFGSRPTEAPSRPEEIYSSAVRTGGTAELTLDEFPGQTFPGVIARNSSAIDPASRTLNVEVDVPNSGDKLLPGAYAMVHFKVPAAPSNLTIPSNTLIFRAQGMQVAVVRNGQVQLTPVKIAQDHGATVEVASGLTTADAIVVDPSDSITNGQPVNVVSAPAGAAK